ncbi:Gfo/Idh/MocA family protein [Planctomyces sp. SH-PL14]|uniref:Gfo/Idh/MocA family protein n=1 Tax=Planctomyces sp. SH-PL14 TaxID=1632864 RepID=UPI00078C0D06|nr:Gfo/Idh/MocA family oxidoreductase [Planctomyces sp. SH-PL14]AMV19347.1 Glucose--fructose oxidoreductase precursor [Planctomyces sp. SH-PL14]
MPAPPISSRRDFLGAAGAWGASMMAGLASADSVPLAPPDKQPVDVAIPEKPEKTVGWAIVGLGKLALEEILPAFGRSRLSRVTALVSGHPDKAKKVADVYGVPESGIYNYETYDRLADNPDVDAIYIVLPNSMHAEYTIRGFQAKKHVLCEKPMAANVAECEAMIAAGREAERKLMIAYRLRYEPFNKKVIELCRSEELGPIQSFSASNCQVVEAPNIRLSGELAGGPLGDIGVYCLNAARYCLDAEPIEVSAFAHQPETDPRFREVPAAVSFAMKFPGGVLATCDCSFNASESRRYRVQCQKGFIDLENAFSYEGQILTVASDKRRAQLQIAPVDHFAAEMDHFSECILGGNEPRTPGEEGLKDMKVMAAIETAAKSGRVERVCS